MITIQAKLLPRTVICGRPVLRKMVRVTHLVLLVGVCHERVFHERVCDER